MSDWRENYVICEHVAENEANGTRHKGFRACCDKCWQDGFLTADGNRFSIKEGREDRADGLCVGEVI